MRQLLALTVLSLFACGAYAADATKMTPQQEKMKSCNEQATDKKGDDRKAYMKTCLSAKPAEKPKNKMTVCNEKTKGMTKDDASKARSECMKAT